MNSARHRQATDLFDQALQLPSGAPRERFLQARCENDIDMLEEVRSLLAAHAASSGFLDRPLHHEAGALISRRLAEAMIGHTVGGWRIERLLHTGGMGAVYLAQRASVDFEQQAAVKIIRSEIARAEILDRFTQERQMLAHLHHPNIATLFDGGATEDGLPFLVMEYVPGETIDRWVESRKLGIDERLKLIEAVCSAVQYAHGHLIVHRDIKPGNIMVTDDGTPKLLDFGIAKLLQHEDSATDTTVTQHRMLTPGYASPEQLTGAPITTASDLYSLGVLLYRLLTGRTPYSSVGTLSAAEFERHVSSRQPTLPSKVVTEAGVDGTAGISDLSPRQLQRALMGDLDTIVMKAMHKEPGRRFESATALADDLRRYRSGLPVTARPDTLGYRARKFTQRHWKGLGAVAGAFFALGIGLAVALWQTQQARIERDRTEQINQFLQTILLEADPFEGGADKTVRDVLLKADHMIDERFRQEPDLEAALRFTIGLAQLSLMELDPAERNLVRADELNHALYGPDDERSLRGQAYLAWLAFRRGNLEQAERGYRRVLARLNHSHSWQFRSLIFNDLGVILSELDGEREAIELYQRSLDLTMANDPDHEGIAVTYTNIGYSWHGLGELQLAEENYRHAMKIFKLRYPDGNHPDYAFNLNNLGALMNTLGQPDQALQLYEESLRIRQATLGPDHASTALGHLNVGRLMLETGQIEAARPHLLAALRISRNTLDEDQMQTLIARASVARISYLDGFPEPAAEELRAVHRGMQNAGMADSFIEQAAEWLSEAEQAMLTPIATPDG